MINEVNNLSEAPLGLRQTGGQGGGETAFTSAGKGSLLRARLLRRELDVFMYFR